MARQRRSIGTFGPGVPLERAYRVAPDEDLGGWFESDGEIELTLENEGFWRLSGPARRSAIQPTPGTAGRRRRRGGPDPELGRARAPSRWARSATSA